ncbi:MAG: hypothetical protein M3T55_07530 [Pseudomonadota bacterium]|nr:hypothetical protein [Pseudomonadota bacterium]
MTDDTATTPSAARETALAILRRLGRPLPADFRFDREEAHEREKTFEPSPTTTKARP